MSGRIIVVGLIVAGVALGGGAAAYYYTSKQAAAPAASALAAPAPTPTAADLDRLAAAVAAMPKPTDPEASFAETIGAFDYKTQHFVWVLPPGIHAKGPFTADVVIKHGGEIKHQESVPLTAEFPAPGSRPEYPRSAEIIRLAADDAWPKHLADIKSEVDGLIAQYGPGGGELIVSTSLKTEIGADVRQSYCVEDLMPEVRVFLEQSGGDPAVLKRIDIAGAAPILKAAVLAGCKATAP